MTDAQARELLAMILNLVKAVNHLAGAVAVSAGLQEDVRRRLVQVGQDLDTVVNAAQAFVERGDGDAL